MRVMHVLALGGAGGIESLCVDIARKSKDNNYFYFMWGGGHNELRIRQINGQTEVRHFKNVFILIEYIHFMNYIRKNHIDCIVVQGMSPVLLLFSALYKKTNPQIKLVLYLHADAKDLFETKIKKQSFLYAYKYADGCVAISEFVKNSMLKQEVDNTKVKVIYNGVDLDRYKSDRNKAPSKITRLIFVGRLIKEKGVIYLLQAIEKIKDLCELTIVGDGPERKELEDFINKKGLTNVELVGTQWNVNEWLRKADIFIHPAIWNEGFGITLVEAMSTGMPCIAFNKGAVPEIIENNADGFLVNEVSSIALRDSILYAIGIQKNFPEEWKRICENAIEKSNSFSIETYVTKLSKYVSEL